MSQRILVVEDDDLLRSFLTTILTEEGYRVEAAAGGTGGLERLREQAFDLVITDHRLPGMTGLEVLRQGALLRPEARWVMITAYGSIQGAVEAMKAGASDYLTKPFRDPRELAQVVRRVLRERDAATGSTPPPPAEGFPPLDLVFLGRPMEEIRRLVTRVAPTSATVLLQGPSGTGKELVARLIHHWSPRAEGPFVAVHCASLAESLLESELFGHEKGSFTGAAAARKGRFELADGGTLFLDEIGEVSPAIQVKLLRVLQEREFERVGGIEPVRVDVRVVAATNRDLGAEVAAGRFRDDLFYRLNVFPLTLPPLAERREAILPLARHFLELLSPGGSPARDFSPAAVAVLEGYHWPGNVRELRNAVERAVILAGGDIGPEELQVPSGPAAGTEPEGRLEEAERRTIVQVLAETGGNRRQAARRLGISLRTLQYRIKRYGL
jgi:DNA-binding NtrC family response regulator